MIDAIKQFFQAMWDSTIGTFSGWYDSTALFFSNAYDVILFVIIIGLGILIFKLLKYLSVPGIILGQLIMLTSTITFMITLIGIFATSLVAVYNRIYELSNFLNTSASGVACVYHFLDCLSINGILSIFFTEIFALFIVVLLIRTSSIFLWAFNVLSDKIWKIGVLMGLL